SAPFVASAAQGGLAGALGSSAALPGATHVPTRAGGAAPRETSDRWGLLVFLAGLGALIGAVAYAALLYTSQGPMMRLVVSTTPSGAQIFLDGKDTEMVTPQIIEGLRADRAHAIELRLAGHDAHRRTVSALPGSDEVLVDWHFRDPKVDKAPSAPNAPSGAPIEATRAGRASTATTSEPPEGDADP
ncbi:hypothetical protein L6R52_38680, partial [Myxococcota bacterium]|nr:hypothetical protein [Myxococcota bacterium]